jgi:enoyl-CoA hydratase/carnithine racemase
MTNDMDAISAIFFKKRDAAFWITLNRPKKCNAIHQKVNDGFCAGYQQTDADPEVRVIVSTAIRRDKYAM